MKNSRPVFFLFAFIIPVFLSGQQPKDLGKMHIYDNHFYNKILKDLKSKPNEGRVQFQAIPANIDIPKSVDEFETIWKKDPHSQGRTGTCWDYSASSFYESEIYRLTGRDIKLSEMFFAYNEYLSKADEYIKTRGKSKFSEGSEVNAVTRQMINWGAVPASAYSGNRKNTPYPDHAQMVDDMYALLKSYKARDFWDKELIMNGIKAILNTYLGSPPESFEYEGVKHTPKSFLKEIAFIDPSKYIDFISLKSEPYWSLAEFKVPDNYWHSQDYHNVPLDIFMEITKKAVKSGYSVALGGDVSEPGYLAQYDAAFVPSFDIPSDYIDENARQLRFFNRSTTDDHGVHLVGYKIGEDEKWWFLIKDSSSSSFNGKNKGYYFYHEDYVKLKMMNITVHRSVVEDILKRF